MKLKFPKPTMFTVKALADRWGVVEDLIEEYVSTGELKVFIEELKLVAPIEERERISRLMPRIEPLIDGLDPFLPLFRRKSRLERDAWGNLMPFFIYDVWPPDYEKVINSIRIVIPRSEVERFEKEYNISQDTMPASDNGRSLDVRAYDKDEIIENEHNDNHLPILAVESVSSFDIAAHVKQCKAKNMDVNQIVYELMKKYGKSEKFSQKNNYRISALEIGIAVFPLDAHKSKREKDALEAKIWRILKKIAPK